MLIGRSPWEVTHKVSGHTGPISPTSVIVTYLSPRCTAAETLLCRNGHIRVDTEEPTSARRFQFETEVQATVWYAA